MQTDNPVPPLAVDKRLFETATPAVQALQKQARKEARANARRKFNRTHANPNIYPGLS